MRASVAFECDKRPLLDASGYSSVQGLMAAAARFAWFPLPSFKNELKLLKYEDMSVYLRMQIKR